MTTTVTLPEHEQTLVTQLARQRGTTEEAIVREAVTHYVAHLHLAYRRQLLHEARGIWRDRTDLPSLATLRQEYDELRQEP